jgi:hypothetical protein
MRESVTVKEGGEEEEFSGCVCMCVFEGRRNLEE